MKLSISNIAWGMENDEKMYSILKEYGFSGLEIAPTRILNNPYHSIKEAKEFYYYVKTKYGFEISSMQSIWYGKNEKIFKSEHDRKLLINYTKKAIDFASEIKCKNLVLGCPKNRSKDIEYSIDIAISFFKEIGDYAYSKNTCIALEANPTIYNTDYINDTKSAIELIKKVNSKGFKLNLDLGTIIYNDEDINEFVNYVDMINHIHISEPNLEIIKSRSIHKQLARILKDKGYDKYVSIEIKKQNDVDKIIEIIRYIKEYF